MRTARWIDRAVLLFKTNFMLDLARFWNTINLLLEIMCVGARHFQSALHLR